MAGSWSEISYRSNSAKGGKSLSMYSAIAEFTADASAATVPDLPLIETEPAILTDIGVVFDGTTAPNSVTVTVKDIDGLTVFTDTLTASGRLPCEDRPALVGGCTISISGNTTNSAKAKVVAYFATNLR